MQTYPVFFHDWHGQAYRDGGHWLLVPKHLSDHLGLDWKGQYRKIMTSDLKEGMSLSRIPSMGMMPIQRRETLTLTLPYFGAWVLMITTDRVPESKRALVVDMKRSLLDALERQLAQQFGLPMMEAEEFLRLPMPAWSGMTPDACRTTREKIVADAPSFTAAQLMRVGLAASKVAPLVRRSIYWARGLQRHLRTIGMVPPTPAQQRLLEQPSLFGEG